MTNPSPSAPDRSDSITLNGIEFWIEDDGLGIHGDGRARKLTEAQAQNLKEWLGAWYPAPVSLPVAPAAGLALPIPIEAGKRISDSYGYDQVIIVARKVGDNGTEHVTTYGRNKEHCDVAARCGDFLKHKVMGWALSAPSQAPAEPKARYTDAGYLRAYPVDPNNMRARHQSPDPGRLAMAMYLSQTAFGQATNPGKWESYDLNRKDFWNYVAYRALAAYQSEAHPVPAAPAAPVAMVLHCPECKTRHIDEGEFATKPHHTHACQGCGMVWRPAIGPTVGVQFLPGFKNEPARIPTRIERNLVEAAENLAWAAQVEIQGGHRTRAFIQQHRSKVAFWIKSVRAALSAPSQGAAEITESEKALWTLLDDIDTFGDMYKPEHTPYFKAVCKKAGERFGVLRSDGYDLFRASPRPAPAAPAAPVDGMATPEGWTKLNAEVFRKGNALTILGTPDDEGDSDNPKHDCDAMGCRWQHVIAHAMMNNDGLPVHPGSASTGGAR